MMLPSPRTLHLARHLGASALLALCAGPALAQMSLAALETPMTQTFDALPTATGAWTSNSIAGVYAVRTGTGTTIIAEAGGGNAGGLYSYGSAASSERALGSLGSSNAAAGNFFYGVRLQNNTGATITSLDVAYTGEQWRYSGTAAAQSITFSSLTGSPVTGTLAEFQSAGVALAALDFTSPVIAGTTGALDGNAVANRTARSGTIQGLSIPVGGEIMLRWSDIDHPGSDHGLTIDNVVVTAHGGAVGPSLSIADVSHAEGNSGTQIYSFTATLSAAQPGDVTFDIATADDTATAPSDYIANSASGVTILAGATSATFDVVANGDTVSEADELFLVQLSNAIGASIGDGSAFGILVNDDGLPPPTRIHEVQGTGAASPLPGSTVTVEGVVIGSYQGTAKLSGFFLQEEDADTDADPATSEGLFVFCGTCATAVMEGQRVRATGVVSEFFTNTQITASAAGSVLVVDAGNHLAEVTPAAIALPIVGDVDAFNEARENMLVRYTDTLQVGEYFQLARYGQVTLYEGPRPRQFTADNAPSTSGYSAHLAELARHRVLLDDEDNVDNGVLAKPDGQEAIYLPHTNGGFGIGTQGIDFFRGGDRIENLTGVLHWSFAGTTGTDAWRIRPSTATPAQFTVANPRPASAPQIDGAIKAAGVNVLNYFSTIDTTSSSTSGPCGPAADQDCRGADSAVELFRQRERTVFVLCGLEADVIGLIEIENHATGAALNDLVDAVNLRCGGAHQYAIAGSPNSVGSDAIRVALIYRTGVLSPVGSRLVDTDAVHNRPPNAQTFDVVDAANPAFGQRFTTIVNHFKSKSCSGASGANADAGDGQGCFSQSRTQQATRLLTWINGTVIPAAGDPDVLLLGDFNAYGSEAPVSTLGSGQYTDLMTALLDDDVGYSYLFDGQLGHLDYAFASSSLLGQVADVMPWHINADEVPVFDYNDEIKDVGESTFEEEPDGAALVPPRTLFQAESPYRASDHDPVLVGLFPAVPAADLGIAITDTPDPVQAGAPLTYQITVTNAGPDSAENPRWTGILPVATGFVDVDVAMGWNCSVPGVGTAGTVTCTADSATIAAPAVFTVTVDVDVAATGSVVYAVTVDADSADANGSNDTATATTAVTPALQGALDITPATLDFDAVAVDVTSSTLFATLSNGGDAVLHVSAIDNATAPYARNGGTCGALPITLAAGDHCTVGYRFSPDDAGAAQQSLAVTSDAPGDSALLLRGEGIVVTGPQADIRISIDDGRAGVAEGERIDYTIVVTNPAGSPTATVAIDDDAPTTLGNGAWLCTPDAGASCADGTGPLQDTAVLPGGTSVTYVYSATLQPGSLGSTLVYTVTATVTPGVTDPDMSNNTASDTDQIVSPIFSDGFEDPTAP